MDITTMEAVRRIRDRHLVGQVEARRVLSSGLAGPGRRDGRRILYDDEAVRRLLDRPPCPRQTLDEVRPIIARLGRDRSVNVGDPWEETADSVRTRWYVPRLISLTLHPPSDGPVLRQPFVATLASWVVFGGEIAATSFAPAPERRAQNRAAPLQTFILVPPGRWYDRVAGTWLPLDANSPTLTWWGAPITTPDGADSLSADYEDQVRRAADERASRSAATARALFQEDGFREASLQKDSLQKDSFQENSFQRDRALRTPGPPAAQQGPPRRPSR